jgi:hypothetical protein
MSNSKINDPKQGSNLLDNITFSIDIDNLSNVNTSCAETVNTQRPRTVKVIHCGDGIVEECEEDELEKERLEKEKREEELELQRKMDLEAVSIRLVSKCI